MSDRHPLSKTLIVGTASADSDAAVARWFATFLEREQDVVAAARRVRKPQGTAWEPLGTAFQSSGRETPRRTDRELRRAPVASADYSKQAEDEA